MIWVPAAAAVLFAIGATFESSPHRGILLAVSIVFVITIALFYKLTIMIESKTLRWWFGVGIISREVPLAEIVECEPIGIRWWYGWGIHRTPYGWLYNVSGLDALAISLRNGGKFALGTDDADGLTTAIRRSIDQQH